MKKYLIALLLVCSSYLSAASWNATPGMIPLGNGTTGALLDVTMAYYPKLKKVVAAWADVNSSLPYYSVYNGTSWTTALPLSNTIAVQNNINLQSFPKLQIVVAAWGQPITQQSYYSIFNGTSWTVPATIDTTNVHKVADEIGMTYDKLNNRIIAAWADAADAGHPVFSVLSGNTIPSLTWSTTGNIHFVTGLQAVTNVYLAYNKVNNEVVAVWANFSMSTFPFPVYSAFNTATFPTSAITWGMPTAIALGTSTGVFNDVRIASQTTTPDMVVAWANASGFSHTPYSAQWNGTSFNTGNTLPLPGGCAGVLNDVVLAVNKLTDSGLGAWGCSLSSSPAYFVNPPFSDGLIPEGTSAGVKANVNLAFDEQLDQMVGVWVDTSSNQPFFNIYQYP